MKWDPNFHLKKKDDVFKVHKMLGRFFVGGLGGFFPIVSQKNEKITGTKVVVSKICYFHPDAWRKMI